MTIAAGTVLPKLEHRVVMPVTVSPERVHHTRVIGWKSAMVESNSVVQRLETLGERVTRAAGAVLFDQGQPGTGVYVVESGVMRLSLLDDEGCPVWSRTAKPGSILGLPSTLGHTPYSLRATAVGQVELVFVSQRKLQELVRQDTIIGTALLTIVSQELVDLRRKLSLLNLQIPKRKYS